MDALVEKLGIEIAGLPDPAERGELHGALVDLKAIQNQKRKALNQVSISLGRACHSSPSLHHTDEMLSTRIAELEEKVLAIWS